MRILVLFLGLYFTLATCPVQASSLEKTYELKGKISGDANNLKVFLITKGFKKIDSAVINNNSFTLKGAIQSPDLYFVLIDKNKSTDPRTIRNNPLIPVFIENGSIQITSDLDKISQSYEYDQTKYKFHATKVEGSALHNTYVNFVDAYKPISDKRMEAFDKYINYLNPKKGESKGPYTEGIECVTEVDKAGLIRNNFVIDFIKKNSTSPVVYTILSDYGKDFKVGELQELSAIVNKNNKDAEWVKNFNTKSLEYQKSAVGSPFIDFDFHDDKGNPVKLSDYLAKGKYVLLEFWASWCGPCRADLPHLKKVYDMYHPAGFEVISISLDDDKDKWLQAIKEEQMKWIQVSDLKAFNGDLSKLYNFSGIPTCILIGPDGKIVTRNMRGSWMDKKLIELYGNKFE